MENQMLKNFLVIRLGAPTDCKYNPFIMHCHGPEDSTVAPRARVELAELDD